MAERVERCRPQEVLREYSLSVEEVAPLKRGRNKALWYVGTAEGGFALKCTSMAQAKVLFSLDAHEHIAEREGPVPRLARTQSGQLGVIRNGTTCFLTEWVEGNRPDDGEQLPVMMSGLAEFHRASRGYLPDDGIPARSRLGYWPKNYARKIEQLGRAHRRAEESGMDRAALTLFARHMDRAVRAREHLLHSAYARWVEEVERSGNLCHRDLNRGNWVVREGRAYLLDLDHVRYELPARDIRQMIIDQCARLDRVSTDRVTDMIRWYEVCEPLTSEQREVVLIDILFPHRFHKKVKDLRSGKVRTSGVREIAESEERRCAAAEDLLNV